jgi:hypothetical protein
MQQVDGHRSSWVVILGGRARTEPAGSERNDDMGRSMPSFIKNLTFDCQDALRVARFWAAALVSDVDEESTAECAYVEAPQDPAPPSAPTPTGAGP